MALFKKEQPADRLRADLEALRGRRADLDRQLTSAKEAAAARQKTLEDMLIKEESDAAVEKAEVALGDAERRVRSRSDALTALDQQILNIEIAIAERTRRKAAEEAATTLDRAHEEFDAKVALLIKAADALAPAADTLGAQVEAAKELLQLARVIVNEVPLAQARINEEKRGTRNLILRQGNSPAS